MQLSELYSYINEIAPFCLQEEWDNSGLQVGDMQKEVKRVLLSLDATKEVVEEAKEKNCEAIVTHHPFLFHAQKQFINDNPAFLAAKYDIAAISAHTSYDAAQGGVQDVLANLLELTDVFVAEDGLLRVGKTEKTTVSAFSKFVKEKLHTTVGFSLGNRQIETVALCSGAGADLWQEAKALGADVFLTGEMKHHEVLDANAEHLATISAGHFETEIPAMLALKARLQQNFPMVEFLLSESTSPIQYI